MTATVQASRRIPAPPEAVWRTLTSREGMKAYMMGADVTTDWRVGSRITMKGEFKGRAFEDQGEVRAFEPGRRLSYTHLSAATPGQEHLVTFELEPSGTGTEVVVTQASLDGRLSAADREHKAQYERTWAAMLEALERAVPH